MAGRILVTGAGGFVGTALVAELSARGFSVTGIGRRDTGNLGSHTDWQPWLSADIDCIIHLAGRAHVMREEGEDPAAAYDAVNRAATASLAEQAQSAGIRRIIFMSSVKALGEAGLKIAATAPPHPEGDYGKSKLAAEDALRVNAPNCEIVILRPPLVYGPGVKGNFHRLMRVVDRSIPLPLGTIQNARSMVSLKNLCDAVIYSMNCEQGTYCPTDREPLSTIDLFRRIARVMNKPARLFPFPVTLLRLCAKIVGKGETADRLTGSLTLEGWPPGWQPPYPTDDAISETVQWYLNRKRPQS